ncbi:MAG: hypothetical protein GEU75_03575 [Dehalococcoidia bacterium]|nr:hypothetical protein [Dehalococcoidia bacterium]
MQMFGIGILELMVIMVLAVIVVGPDRVPQFAADLAKWIRRTRAYANHLMKDFNDVMGDFEKEVGTSREDWKEIASVVTRHTSDVTKEIGKVATQVERSVDIDDTKTPGPPNVVQFEARPLGETPESATELAADEAEAEAEAEAKPEEAAEERPWYETDTTPARRRRRGASE